MTDCVWQNISIEIPDKPENTFRFGSRAEHDLSTGGNIQNSFSRVSSQQPACSFQSHNHCCPIYAGDYLPNIST